MKNPAQRIGVLLLLLACSTLVGGCTDACEELSRSICDCQITESDELGCKDAVDQQAAEADVTPEENEICEALLDECTCDKLAEGDLAACGLAEDPTAN